MASMVMIAVLLVTTEGLAFGSVLLLLNSNRSGRFAFLRHVAPDLSTRIEQLSFGAHVRIAALVLILITLVRGGLQYIQHLQTLRLRRRVERSLQVRVFERFHDLSLGALQRYRRDYIMPLVNQYPQRIGEFSLKLGQSAASAALVVAYVIVAFFVSWKLILVSLVFLVAATRGVQPRISERLRGASRRNRELASEVSATAGEHLSAMKLIRLFDRRPWSQQLYHEKIEIAHDFEYRAGVLVGLAKPISVLINTLVICGVLLAASSLLSGSPERMLAQLAIFVVIAFRLMGPLTTLAELQNQANEAAAPMEAIFEFLEPIPSGSGVPANGSKRFDVLRRAVTLENVTFRYSSDEPAVLHSVSLEIPRGRTTAIVGPSGSGKSTIVALLTRLSDPASGSVRVDGTDLREFDCSTWRRQMAITSQDVFLFHASVRENMRFAKADATDAEIEAACRMARAHEFIANLPQGYDTVLQEMGRRLSGGQRQRISIARMFLAQASLLILDEATSELDTLTEREIHDIMGSRRRDSTVVIVAHRLSTVRNADRIYVLDKGQIVEHGAHEELMVTAGLYAEMVRATDRAGARAVHSTA
jgi:ABC-type multidrug transport system fused ATPase/permease subunit